MSEPVPDRLRRVLAQVAEHIHRGEAEAEQERRRLEAADDATLRRVLSDRVASRAARLTALGTLVSRLRRDRALSELLLPLFDDPDDELARQAISYAPPFDPRMVERLHALLDDPREGHWSTAAATLARHHDRAILPRLLAWFRDGDRPHRNVAFAGLAWLLGPDDRRALLQAAWDQGGRDDDDRAMLAGGLLDLGDPRGVPFLESLARRADHPVVAPFAVETIRAHDPARGLELALWVLDHGDPPEVKWGMVERIARAARLPHDWTADGLAEARNWVEQQLRALGGDQP